MRTFSIRNAEILSEGNSQLVNPRTFSCSSRYLTYLNLITSNNLLINPKRCMGRFKQIPRKFQRILQKMQKLVIVKVIGY